MPASRYHNHRQTALRTVLSALCLALAVSCSTQKNTSASRWWHGFNARYNTYYNGTLAYIDGSLAKEQGNRDNFTEQLPLYTVGNKASRELGKANFQTAVLKAKKAIQQHSIKKRPEWKKSRRKTERDLEWLSRREYNPFLWKAWMLMGRSQFHMGAFDEAAATFSYMSRLYRTQPPIYGKARAWLAKCYIEQDWMYDAEDVIRNMSRDSIDWRARREWDNALCDYYLHSGDWEQAAAFLRKVIKSEQRSRQRAREWFLLGQVLAKQGKAAEAYAAYKHVVRQNPPYELEFNARIAMTEVLPTASARHKISRLRSMARSDKNADYLDQVYYALGNVYLAQGDTVAAISAYERGNTRATRSGIEKGVLLLRLGDVYWQREHFSDAQRCYGEAIGLLDKERPDYEQLAARSKVLDELAPYTDAVHLQDSLQALASASEAERFAAIDRVIAALKKKEKEERLAALESQAQNNGQQNAAQQMRQSAAPATPTMRTPGQPATWYFYSPTAVQQGKQTFLRTWGQRENADNWQRANKTVVATAPADTTATDDGGHSVPGVSPEDSTETKTDTAALDPHRREYYLAQIPFTPEQMEESNATLSDALFHSGVIFKDKLDNLPLAEKALLRLNRQFPDYQATDETYYHLFLLYSRRGDTATASRYKTLLAEKYADSEWTRTVCDPYFRENALYGTHMEDSLYADTYDAFRQDRHTTVERNCQTSEVRFPRGAHRDKFLFVGGLSRLNNGDPDSCLSAMKRVVDEFPQSEVATMAGMIINGVNAGRRLHASRFDIADIWDYRAKAATEDGDTASQHFTDDEGDEYVFLMTYCPDSIGTAALRERGNVENQLLYEIARYNFTSYLVRNFDITIDDFQGLHRLSVSGFRNHDEALAYARSLCAKERIMALAQGSRNIVISAHNLALLGTQFSYNDYDDYYGTHLAPVAQPSPELLNEQVVSPELYDPETRPASESGDDTAPDAPEASPTQSATSTEIAIEPEPATPVGTATGTVIATDAPQPVPADTLAKPKSQPKPQQTARKNVTATRGTTVRQDLNADVLEIIDPTAQKATQQKKATKKETKRDDDEYFDLDGF